MKLPVLPCLLSLVCGVAAGWITPGTAPPPPALESARPVQSLPLVRPQVVSSQSGRGEAFARHFPKGEWKAEAAAWAAEAPAEFCAWLVERGVPPGEEVLQLLFTAWVNQAPRSALAALENLPAGYLHSSCDLYKVLIIAVLKQPRGLEIALPWMGRVDPGRRAFGPEVTGWMTALPPDAMAVYLATHSQPGDFYEQLVGHFAGWWAEQDRAAAMKWVRTLEPRLQSSAFGEAMKNWAEKEPRAVVAWLNEQPDGVLPYGGEALIVALAEAEPRTAMEYALHDHRVGAAAAVRTVFDFWSLKDAPAALAFARTLGDREMRQRCLRSYARGRPADEVAALISSLPVPEDREAVLGTLTEAADPFAPSFLPPSDDPASPSEKARAVFTAECGEIARRDAPRAFDLAANLPTVYRPAALAAVLTQWQGPEGAAAVERMDDGPAKESARAFLKAHGR